MNKLANVSTSKMYSPQKATYTSVAYNKTCCLYFVINERVDEKRVQYNEIKRNSVTLKNIPSAQIFPIESLTELCNILKLEVGEYLRTLYEVTDLLILNCIWQRDFYFSSLLLRSRSYNYKLEENTDLGILKFTGGFSLQVCLKNLSLHSEFYKQNDISQGAVT